jgi:ATP-dependent Clp protease ATP-binding subunit ClpA
MLLLQMGQRMLREEVTAADIAEVTAKWTGIPASHNCDNHMHVLTTIVFGVCCI